MVKIEAVKSLWELLKSETKTFLRFYETIYMRLCPNSKLEFPTHSKREANSPAVDKIHF